MSMTVMAYLRSQLGEGFAREYMSLSAKDRDDLKAWAEAEMALA